MSLSSLKGTFSQVELSGYTTWRIGGPALAVFPGNLEELEEAFEYILWKKMPWTVLGRGSNTLAPSSGWEGAVIILSGGFLRWSISEESIAAGGGASLPSTAGSACSAGLDGLTFAVGIPGTAGGAVFMNAGAYGSCMSDVVRSIEVFSPEEGREEIQAEDCGFGYRRSSLQGSGRIITGVRIKLARSGDPADLRRHAVEVLDLRRRKFPLRSPNAGSVFKRPAEGLPPGKLIEDCGLKGCRIGAAEVSRVHANFIVNLGGATSDDVARLMDHVRESVLRTTGIELHREVRMLGEM